MLRVPLPLPTTADGRWATAGEAVALVGAGGAAILLAQVLDPSDLGTLQTTRTIALLAAFVGGLGLPTLLARQAAVARPGPPPTLSPSGLRWRTSAAAATSVAAAACCWLLAAPSATLAATVGALTVAATLRNDRLGTLRGARLIRHGTLAGSALLWGTTLAAVTALWAFDVATTTTVLAAVTVAYLISAALLQAVTPAGPPTVAPRRVGWLVGPDLGAVATTFLPTLAVALFSTPADVAMLLVAERVGALVALPAAVQGKLLDSKTGGLADRQSNATSAVRTQTRQVGALAAAATCLLALAGTPVVVAVFGVPYGPAATVAVVVAVGHTVAVAVGPNERTLRLLGHDRTATTIAGIGAAATVVGTAVGATAAGAAGAAVAAAAVRTGRAVAARHAARRLGVRHRPDG